MAYFIFPLSGDGTLNHEIPLQARLDGVTVEPFIPSGHVIQWRKDGSSIKEGSTDDTFYHSINTTTVGDVTFNAADTGTNIDFIIDPASAEPGSSNTIILSNNRPTLSAAGPITDAYGRTTGTPTLVWTYSDADSDPQYAYRIKLGSTSGGTEYYDSTDITSGAATTFSFTLPIASIMPPGTFYYWEIEVSDGERITPSLPTLFKVTASGTAIVNTKPIVSNVQIDGVNGGGTITSLTPTISWTYTDVDGQPQNTYRVIIARDSGLTDILWDSGVQDSSNHNTNYNFNLTGEDIESHVLLYAAVTVSDTFENSLQVTETFIVSNAPLITTLTVDNKVNPLNIRNQAPFFNWLYADDDNDPLIAFEIRISLNGDELGTDSFTGEIWAPGIIFTPESYGVRFNSDGNAFPGCVEPKFLQNNVRYYFQVRIYDAFDQSEWATGFFQLNAIPTATNLTIIPTAPYTSDDLFASYEFVDDIGDNESALTQIKWYRKSIDSTIFILVPSLNNILVVPHDETFPGDEWYFTVRPHDGIGYGNVFTSTPVTILNRAPTASALVILPNRPTTTDNLEAIFALSDPDNDPVQASIAWYKNDIEQIGLRNAKIIPASVTSVDEQWHFTVIPNDGVDNGPLAISSKVTILNTPPIINSLSIDGRILPKSVKNANPTLQWNYFDDDLQPQQKYHVLFGTKPTRTRKISTLGRVLSASSGTAIACDEGNGIISTADVDGEVTSGDEIFDSGIIESGENSFQYVTEDFVALATMPAVDFDNLNGYTLAPDLTTLMLRTDVSAGTAIGKFTRTTSFYDIELTYIKEESEKSTYKLIVDGVVVGQFTSQAGKGPATYVFNAIRLDSGSLIGVSGNSFDSGGKAKFQQLRFIPITQLDLNTGDFSTLSGYLQDGSGGIKLAGLVGTANTSFAFPSGTYDIEIIYITETNGNPNLTVSLNNTSILSFTYESGARTRSRFLTGVSINRGDIVKLSGTRNNGALARVKKIIFRPTDTVKVGAKLKDGLTYYASVRVFDGRDWSDWYTTSFTMSGSAWGTSVSNSRGWTIEARFKVSPQA